MIYSFDIEKKVLSGILQLPHKWEEVSSLLTNEDFYSEDSKVNVSIFKLLRNALDNAEKIDETILVERIKQLKVSFPDSIDIAEYIMSLAFYKISDEMFISSVKELKKFTARRIIFDSAKDVANFVKRVDPNMRYSEIVEQSDKLYNDKIHAFELVDKGPTNLFDIMESVVEERGNNPIEEFGMMGPYKRVNEIYGSLLLPGNIAVIVARSGSGKSTLAMDYCTRVGQKYGVPVLHFDNGEMSEEELIFRQCSAMSGVPTWLLQTGQWRKTGYGEWSAEEVVSRVRSVWKKIQDMTFFYENVAGFSADELCSLAKRFYYSKVGRGNPMIWSFDYVKSDFSNLGKSDGWQQVGNLVHRFKQTIHRELSFDGQPTVSMFTSVQSNRLGITNNRNPDQIVDDESVVSLSDNITHFCSHLFLLRPKVADELHEEGQAFGTHKFINLKARHLGREALRHINPVTMPDGSKKRNFINLSVKNFRVEERGDLQDIVDSMTQGDTITPDQSPSELPSLLDG